MALRPGAQGAEEAEQHESTRGSGMRGDTRLRRRTATWGRGPRRRCRRRRRRRRRRGAPERAMTDHNQEQPLPQEDAAAGQTHRRNEPHGLSGQSAVLALPLTVKYANDVVSEAQRSTSRACRSTCQSTPWMPPPLDPSSFTLHAKMSSSAAYWRVAQ